MAAGGPEPRDPQPFPWAAMIAFGLGRLRLPPSSFWQLTLPELAALLGPSAIADAPSRADLAALMQAHPDHGATVP
jgi:uncharacterized phage protein (TIGR02216 family)